MAQLLIERGADKHAQDVDGCSPLVLAADTGSVAVVTALLAAGADPHLPVNGDKSPLHLAARRGHVAIAKTMLELGVDVNVVDMDGATPLHLAKEKNVVDVLVKAGATIEARDLGGATPLTYLSRRFFPEAARALIDHGADVNAQDCFGQTPLHKVAKVAQTGSAAEDADFLLKSGADETIVDSGSKTALDVIGTKKFGAVDDQECDRIRDLLANAPADKVWRRRGLLLLCIDRYRKKQLIAAHDVGIHDASSVVPVAGGTIPDKTDGDSARLAAWASRLGLGLGTDVILRAVVEFLNLLERPLSVHRPLCTYCCTAVFGAALHAVSVIQGRRSAISALSTA